MTQLLKKWLTQGPFAQQLISFNHHDLVTGALFTNQVAYFYEQLLAAPEKKWLLASDASDLFAVGLCAALLAGKEIILPANIQTGTLSELTHEFDGILSDKPLCESHAFILLKKELSLPNKPWPASEAMGDLVLFTSGSSGEPKAIRKTLTQLDIEVSVLEHTFAEHLPHCSVISTVSHQHIYGLLFKILWPLAASRPFLSEQIEYPETLSYYTALLPNLCLISSPAQLSRLPKALEHERQLRSPSLVFSSGGPLSFAAATGINQCYGHLPIEIFGSTETGGIAYRRQHEADEPWQVFDRILIDQDLTDGALLLKSPYLADDEWLRCEDKIEPTENGQFRLKGRLDRIVKIEEKRLSLAQMETLMCSHAYVEQTALVILPQFKSQLGAVITLSELGRKVLQEQGKLSINNALKAHLLAQFERVTLPRRWRYPDILPLSTQGKRVTTELVELFNHD
ncbi:AMP-binding protein [Shewanella glacialipiscicola]|uniref:Aconitate hydratase n=1 Tax=Shewanella glacialipiscicola TaxID=614069 RepID=A0ABQ6J670_9GAMM|nr:AMP-binding protein [Shewanella glacialipiscicola]MCL1085591.1 AMP-binding protein [Shewanella glacialipiscicola]GIU03619.1 aconitate hydratase [Shewanella glacialipiscicola]GMA83648.1 aconitate hydratase [Shewanella glacialipiscicola]